MTVTMIKHLQEPAQNVTSDSVSANFRNFLKKHKKQQKACGDSTFFAEYARPRTFIFSLS